MIVRRVRLCERITDEDTGETVGTFTLFVRNVE